MDPVSALSFAVNIIDLVDKAIKGVTAVVEVYNSVDGLSAKSIVIDREAQSLRDIVKDLEDHQSHAPRNIADRRIRELSTTITSRCSDLQLVLDECKPSQKRHTTSAVRAVYKTWYKSGKIEKLQNEIVSLRKELFDWIASNTNANVDTILKRLEAITQTNCDIQKTLKDISDRFYAISGTGIPEKSAATCLDEIRHIVVERIILRLLDLPILGVRFEEVMKQEEGTFEWIFTDPESVHAAEPALSTTFPEWLRSGDGIFHICGKPGSGKSTLMKYICRNPDTEELLTGWSGNDKLIFAKFFFWRIGGPGQKTTKGLIQGLLYQILCEAPELSRKLFSRETQDRLIDHLQKGLDPKLESEEIIAAFSQLVEAPSLHAGPDGRGIRICLFIDGLDEFDNTQINQFYGDLVRRLRKWTTNSDGHVKICVSSRIEPPFMEMLDRHKRLTLHNLTKRDINLVIQETLEKNPKFHKYQRNSQVECQELVETIKRSAEGVFLWVILVLKKIEEVIDYDGSIQTLQKTVSNMPKDVEQLLRQIMNGIQEDLRGGVELLLATLLRATAASSLPEDQASEYFPFFESFFGDSYSYDIYELTALSAFLVLSATEKGISMEEDLTMSKFEIEKEPWFHDDMSNADVMNMIYKIVQERCKGLVDIVLSNVSRRPSVEDEAENYKVVKFMHRSVPEFLHTYFSLSKTPALRRDQHATVVISWAFLTDLKLMEVNRTRGFSLVSFLRGKTVLPVAEEFDQWCITWDHEAQMSFNEFTCILRQIEHGAEWDELYRVLVQIILVLGPSIGNRLIFLERCAYSGLHEFIDWLFRKTDILVHDAIPPRLVKDATRGIIARETRFPLTVMESVFAHGNNGRMIFSWEENGFIGTPVWHHVLLHLTSSGELYRSNSRLKAIVADTIYLWLSHGANPRVSFRLTKDGCDCLGVSNSQDRSDFTTYGVVYKYDSAAGGKFTIPTELQAEGREKISLRDWVLYEKFYNESSLLELLPDDNDADASDGLESENIVTNLHEPSKEVNEGSPALRKEKAVSVEDADNEVIEKNDLTVALRNPPQDGLHREATGNTIILYNRFIFISALGLVVTFVISYFFI
ncbi:hypothetical protein F4777DRAFT_98175 [Nemania sp. FL0916]|nr:hypothetical protein F4777DRAFT_98175 [Nemania sp. FL0916]